MDGTVLRVAAERYSVPVVVGYGRKNLDLGNRHDPLPKHDDEQLNRLQHLDRP